MRSLDFYPQSDEVPQSSIPPGVVSEKWKLSTPPEIIKPHGVNAANLYNVGSFVPFVEEIYNNSKIPVVCSQKSIAILVSISPISFGNPPILNLSLYSTDTTEDTQEGPECLKPNKVSHSSGKC